MENFLNEQTVKVINNKFFHILNYVIPGIFVNEIFFKKGFFSSIPSTLYEFLLYLIWCFIFTIPYGILSAFSVSELMQKLKEKALKDETVDNEKLLANFEKFTEESKEDNERLDSVIAFFYVIIYLLITFAIYKFLTYKYEYESYINVSPKTLIFFNTIFIFYIVYFLIIRTITKLLYRYYVKHSNQQP